MSSRKVSVIIAAYNAASTIEAAVLSALPEADEVLVVDDASTDGTHEQVLGIQAHPDKRLSVIHTKSKVPLGPVAARNLGISFAVYPLIICLDADDTFLEGGITALRASYSPNHFVYGGAIVDGKEQPSAPPGMIRQKNITWLTWLYHVDDWRRVGGYPFKYAWGGESWALMCALLAAGVHARQIPEYVFTYNQNVGQRVAVVRKYYPILLAQLRQDYPQVVTP